mmetsp:Transcript_28861/g.62718  ORF Transcript_28861/g.62718 Transcript_28861/m.62718 type:complete len:308 (+) Transcript_28861:175-1098(+)
MDQRRTRLSLRVQGPNASANGLKLNVAGAFVDGSNLGISVVLLSQELFGETNTTQPINTLRRHILRHFGGLQLGHGSLQDERLAALLQPCSIEHQQSCSFNLHPGTRILKLHALEVRDALAKLFPCDHVAHGIVKGTLCQTNHLGTNPNATFVQQLDSNLVALAHLTEHSLLWHTTAFKDQLTGGGRTDAQLVFLLADLQTFVVHVHHERCDASMSLAGIRIGEDYEDTRLHAVGDPAFAAIEHPVAAITHCFGLQGEGIGAAVGFRKAEGSDGICCQARQILLLKLLTAISFEGRDQKGVVNVHEG